MLIIYLNYELIMVNIFLQLQLNYVKRPSFEFLSWLQFLIIFANLKNSHTNISRELECSYRLLQYSNTARETSF
jgi:hypothetical protein